MRHSLYLAFAVALVAGSAQARADMVTYNMSGTITGANYPNMPYAAGDHITWTLQFDRSTPMTSGGTNAEGPWANYQMQGTYVFTNIVDQTTGYHFPLLPPSNTNLVGMTLQNINTGNQNYGNIFAYQNDVGHYSNDSISLSLRTGSLPSLNLAEFQFNKLPVVLGNVNYSNFQYSYVASPTSTPLGFIASVDSIPGAIAAAPEPGSLTLFLLGAAGLATRGMRRRLGQVG